VDLLDLPAGSALASVVQLASSRPCPIRFACEIWALVVVVVCAIS
jgi:hypothetical protein